MPSSSSQSRVRQPTQTGFEASRAKEENRTVIMERNIIRQDVMVAPFSFIDQKFQENRWQSLYSCSNPVYPRLVKDFYGLHVQDSEECPIYRPQFVA